MLDEIKAALENATPEWHYNGNEIVSKQNVRRGIGGFLTDEDNVLAANAPEWLRYLVGEVERLENENEQYYRSSNYWNHKHSKETERAEWYRKALEDIEELLEDFDTILALQIRSIVIQALERSESN